MTETIVRAVVTTPDGHPLQLGRVRPGVYQVTVYLPGHVFESGELDDIDAARAYAADIAPAVDAVWRAAVELRRRIERVRTVRPDDSLAVVYRTPDGFLGDLEAAGQ